MNDTPAGGQIRVLRILARMNVGGPAWQASVLTRGLSDGPFTTRLICGRVGDDEADFIELRDPDLPVQRIESLGRSVRLGGDIWALLAICREIREFRPHIVHTHTAKAGVLGRIAAIFCRVPIQVHTFHGHVLSGYFSPAVTQVVRIVEAALARRSTALVAVGEGVRDDLIERGIGRAHQYTVIPPGVSLDRAPGRIEAREILDLPPDVPVALFVGRLTRIKRIDRLIESMAAVLRRLPDTVLVLAGEGDQLEGARQQARPLGSSVRFLGWRTDLSTLYAAADVAVITSDNEGMPVSLIEASLAGLPSVTTDVGSAGEVVIEGVTGRVVAATTGSVADALVEILGDDDLRLRMGEAAREHGEQAFGVLRLVRDHEVLYRRLISECPTGRRRTPR
ncbi:MAG: glycosyl transferase [Acidobacteria bacterium]|nr:glycosyl transferase [Acidobacteriota bacterium]